MKAVHLKLCDVCGTQKGLAFRMKDGDKVVAGGIVDVYERDGRISVLCKGDHTGRCWCPL